MPTAKQKTKSKREPKKTFEGFMCGTALFHDGGIGNAHSVVIYRTVRELKEDSPCWDRCGIVRVKVTEKVWLEPEEMRLETGGR
jgi:hypothetical protein